MNTPPVHSRIAVIVNGTLRRSNLLIAIALGATFEIATVDAAVRTVALSGQTAPGAPEGVNYGSFGAYYLFTEAKLFFRGPVINDAGQVAFRANLTGAGVDATNNQGVWSEGSGSLAMIARTGGEAPGVPDGVNFGRNPALELFTPVLNNAGQTAFYGGLSDGTVGLWSEGSGSLALVARDGTPAPDTSEGVDLSFGILRDFSLFTDLPKLNDAGRTLFSANLTGEGLNYTNDWGIWSESTGSLGLVVRSGSPAPGTPEGVNFDSFFFPQGFNDAGRSAFFAFITGEGVNVDNDQGIWSGDSGSLAMVARSGNAAPGTPAGVTFDEFLPPVGMNNAGHVAFQAWLAGDGVDSTNDEGIWSDASGTLELVARRGSPAPGTPAGVTFDYFSTSGWPVINDADQLAFRAELTGSGVTPTNNRGIWVGTADDLVLAARAGDHAPGTPNGVTFNELWRPTLNDAGQIAVLGMLQGSGVFSSNNLGIWATDQDGALQLIARTGSQLEVSPGVFRTISDLGFVGDTGNSDGRASAFNNLGELVFWARFTNGSQGVFVSNLVAQLSGDFNNDGAVDATDYIMWRKNDGTEVGYDAWQSHFGRTLSGGNGATIHPVSRDSRAANYAIPEPTGILLAASGLSGLILRRRRPSRHAIHSSTKWGNIQARTPTESCSLPSYRCAANKHHYACSISTLLAFAAAAAIAFVSDIAVEAGTIEFDPSRKSPAVIPFDPNGSFEASHGYMSGRVPTSVKGPIFGGSNINTLLGAEAFYSHGYTGTNAAMATIEAGHIWSGHETLMHVQQITNHPSALNEFDRHNTWVGMIMGGRRDGANPGPHQDGLAPNAQLFSGAIATQFNGQRPSANFSVSDAVTYDIYRKAFSTGMNASGRTADVINTSWGGLIGSNGSDNRTIALDALANANSRTLFVPIAHNFGPGPDKVTEPGAGYNNLCVAALGPNPPYDRPAWFSSGGPNDYADPVNGTVNNARQVVDIAAPGENLSAAYYGGETGGNGTTDNPNVSGPGPTGLPNGGLGGPDYYTRGGIGGTSFAAPTVAGGAALLYDAAYTVFADNADARDARVMKAVLMNSADKTIGWNNEQVAHPNGNGGVFTSQGLDNRVGTGRMNLSAAYDQFLSGTTDITGTSGGNLGLVNGIGWDFGQVVSGTTNDYFFNAPLDGGSTLTATLTWFRDRRINASNTVFDDSFDDLNLELWSVVDGTPSTLISESSSLYNESEHFSFALPATGDYALRVRWFAEVFDRVADANQEQYGLAWSAVAIPEPDLVAMMAVAVISNGLFTLRSRYRKPSATMAVDAERQNQRNCQR